VNFLNPPSIILRRAGVIFLCHLFENYLVKKIILIAPQKNCVKNLFGVKRFERNTVRSPATAGQVYFFQRNAEEIQQLFCRAYSFVTFLQRKVKAQIFLTQLSS
jgi:hypothetical protein